MSLIEENTFRIQFPAKKELAVLLEKPRSKEMEPTWVSCAVLWSTSWSVAMSTHYLPHFSILAVNVPARFNVSWVPQEPHVHKEKGDHDAFSCVDVQSGHINMSLQHGWASFSGYSF